MKAADLKTRIKEMLRIKVSVSNELRDLENKRQKLQVEVNSFTQRIDELKQEMLHQQTDLDRLKISVVQAQAAQREAVERNTPELAPPRRILMNSVPAVVSATYPGTCKMYNCFDHSRCALTSGFPVYLYDPDLFNLVNAGWDVDGFLKTTIKQTLGKRLFSPFSRVSTLPGNLENLQMSRYSNVPGSHGFFRKVREKFKTFKICLSLEKIENKLPCVK